VPILPPETGGRAPPSCPRSPATRRFLSADSASLINIVLNGSAPLVVKGNPAPLTGCRQYRAQLTNQQIADVVTFIRNGWGNSAGAGFCQRKWRSFAKAPILPATA